MITPACGLATSMLCMYTPKLYTTNVLTYISGALEEIMKRINLYLPEELIERLQTIASENGSTFSSLTREVLEGFVASTKYPDMRAPVAGATIDELARIERVLVEQNSHLKDVKAVLDLVLHFSKRGTDR
jgi:hypothetical protein